MSTISSFPVALLAALLCAAYGGHVRFTNILHFDLGDDMVFDDFITHLPPRTQRQYQYLEAKMNKLPDNYHNTTKTEIRNDTGARLANVYETQIKETTVRSHGKLIYFILTKENYPVD